MPESSGRRDKNIIMSPTVVVAVVSLGFICVSVLVGLAVGAILGQVSRELSDLLEAETAMGADAAAWTARRRMPAPSA